MTIEQLPTPFYIIYEDKLRRNLDLIAEVSRRSGAKIIMAFKANALWRTFHIMREYGIGFTASSLNELRLGHEFLGHDAHSYCPAYTDATIDEYLKWSTHITFNSLGQWAMHKDKLKDYPNVSAGLRVNPKCSVIETDLYNPALPGSRFGVSAEEITNHKLQITNSQILDGIEGLHFHALCESSSYDLEKVLAAFEEQFGHLLPQMKWVNFGGGHLMTREGYDTEHLIRLIQGFRERYPWLEVILEPGSAFTWRTGDLITSVVDVVSNDGVNTAIVDVSFACHMPDTLEMPYQPLITQSVAEGKPYMLGGNSCLSGDYCGPWHFDHDLKAGERLTLEDMNHYTTVKTTMFNGIQHPAIVLCDSKGDCQYLRQYDYEDYKSRMS
ncbi:MAG: carboxynorspermidine decarboxylase [Bacteroidales bacterium]|nr:carboxynorspermidine decarboxylase [Bacteroidales bacterium]